MKHFSMLISSEISSTLQVFISNMYCTWEEISTNEILKVTHIQDATEADDIDRIIDWCVEKRALAEIAAAL